MSITNAWILVGTLLSGAAGWAMGHGPQPDLGLLPEATQTVFFKVHGEHQIQGETLGEFALGSGQTLVIWDRQSPKSDRQAVQWEKGTILAWFEGKPSLQGDLIAGEKNRGLYFMGLGEYAQYWHAHKSYVHALRPGQTWKRGFTAIRKPLPALLQDSEVIEIKSTDLRARIGQLAGEVEVTFDGRTEIISDRGNAAPRSILHDWMVSEYRSFGLDAESLCYRDFFRTGCNIEARIAGTDPNKVVLVTAHIDSVRNKGADDDGSGTAAMMEIAKRLADRAPQAEIRFVGFDQEELGLVGSKVYARQLADEGKEVLGVLQMDMIGYDSDNDGAIHLIDCGRRESQFLSTSFESVSQKLGLNLVRTEACTNRSDHASFWNVGIPAILVSENFFGGDENPCYHQNCDKADILNMSYLTRITNAVANTTWLLAKTD